MGTYLTGNKNQCNETWLDTRALGLFSISCTETRLDCWQFLMVKWGAWWQSSHKKLWMLTMRVLKIPNLPGKTVENITCNSEAWEADTCACPLGFWWDWRLNPLLKLSQSPQKCGTKGCLENVGKMRTVVMAFSHICKILAPSLK